MSCEEIKEFMRERYDFDARKFSDTLPAQETFTWIPWGNGVSPDIPEALVIGSEPSRETLAYMVPKGDKAHEIRYCWRNTRISNSSASPSDKEFFFITQEEAVTMKLVAPFRFNADSAKTARRKFGAIIKWYFAVRGLISKVAPGHVPGWCKVFHSALKTIPVGGHITVIEKNINSIRPPMARKQQTILRDTRTDETSRASGSSSRDVGEQESPPPTRIEESQKTIEVSSSYELRSVRRSMNSNTLVGANEKSDLQEESNVPEDQGVDNFRYRKVCAYLDNRGETYLLKNIPEASNVQFYDGKPLPSSLPWKLYIGKTSANKENIYAHLCLSQEKYIVRFWSRHLTKHDGEDWRMQDLVQQNVIHPFNKTYSKHRTLGQADQVRLENIVIWYFLAKCYISKEALLRQDPTFEQCLSGVLRHIADQMGPAAVSRPSGAPSSQSANMSPRPRPVESSRSLTPLAFTSESVIVIARPPNSNSASQPSNSNTILRPPSSTPAPQLSASRPSNSTPAPGTLIPGRTRIRGPGPEPNALQKSTSSSTRMPTRGTKRTAKDAADAAYAALHESTIKERALTASVNRVDAELETLDMKKENYFEIKKREKQELEKTLREEQAAKKNKLEEEKEAKKKKLEEEEEAKKKKLEEETGAKKKKLEEEEEAKKKILEAETEAEKKKLEEETEAEKKKLEEEMEANIEKLKEETEAVKRDYMDDWEIEHDSVLGRRGKLDEERTEVRRKARRLLQGDEVIVIK